MTANIRLALPADAEGIASVHIESWQWAYRGLVPKKYLDEMPGGYGDRVQRWRAILGRARAPEWTFLAEEAGLVIGFVSIGAARDDNLFAGTGEVCSLYLSEHASGTGLGRRLFASAENALRSAGFTRATLWVLDGNVRARRFYEAAGWAADGTSKVDSARGFDLQEVRYTRVL